MNDLPPSWENANCPLCGCDRWNLACSSRDWILESSIRPQIVRCSACGMAYVNPRPSVAEIGRYYPASYGPYQQRKSKSRRHGIRWTMLRWAWGAPSVKPSSLACFAMRLLALVRSPESLGFGVPYQGQGRLLDFGCGSGDFLRRMADLGWTVTGVDFSQDAVNTVRAAGIEAYIGTLPNPNLGDRRFDVITMRMSLEHVHNPLETIRAACELLEPGGKLVIITPNFDAWDRTHFGEAWYALDLSRHLMHFEPATMRDLLQRAGLQVASIQTSGDDGILRKSLVMQKDRVGQGAPPPNLLDRLLHFKPILKLFAWSLTQRNKGNDLLSVAVKQT